MRTLFLSIIAIIFSTICFCACNQENSLINEPENLFTSNDQTGDSELQSEADSLCLSVEQVKNLTPKAKQERRFSLIMAEHTYLNNQAYSVDITEDEALRLGIPSYFYIETIDHLKTINDQINKAILKGAKIDLVDIRNTVIKLKQQKNYSISRGFYDPSVPIGTACSFGNPDTIFATHRSNESFVGTIICTVTAEMTDPKHQMGSLSIDAISTPYFHDDVYKTIPYKNASYYFDLKVKPFGLKSEYMVTLLSYPYYIYAQWFPYQINHTN